MRNVLCRHRRELLGSRSVRFDAGVGRVSATNAEAWKQHKGKVMLAQLPCAFECEGATKCCLPHGSVVRHNRTIFGERAAVRGVRAGLAGDRASAVRHITAAVRCPSFLSRLSGICVKFAHLADKGRRMYDGSAPQVCRKQG